MNSSKRLTFANLLIRFTFKGFGQITRMVIELEELLVVVTDNKNILDGKVQNV